MDSGIMVRDKNPNQNNTGDGGGRDGTNPQDLVKLLKSFYHPEKNEMQEFDEFFSSIEKKINDQNPVNKIIQVSTDLEHDYELRQMKLEESINRLEHNLKLNQALKQKKSTQLKAIIIVAAIIAVVVFVCVLSF
jgi:t-SNARE complex subunit (syntaxin)